MRPIKGKEVKGIGVVIRSIGEENIQIKFRELCIGIDVVFLIRPEKIPILLSMKDMMYNKLDLSLQDLHLTLNGKTRPLQSNN